MNIMKIKISNFKSLKQTQDINLSSQLITFVGKNGSGKTNILDALFTLFDSSATKERVGMNYRFYMEISNDDFAIFKKVFKIKETERVIEAYSTTEDNGFGLNINRIKSSLLNDLLHSSEESIYTLTKEFMREMEEYRTLINDFTEDNHYRKQLTFDLDFGVEDINNSSNYGFIFSNVKKEIDVLLSQIGKLISERKHGEELILSLQYLPSNFNLKNYGNFRLKYTRPKLTKFEQKHITINEDVIKDEIEKINLKAAHHIGKIADLYDKLKAKLDEFSSLVDARNTIDIEEDSAFDGILKRIVSVCNPKIYYLRNENNQLFFKNEHRWNAYYHSVGERIIIDTFIKSKYKALELGDLKAKTDTSKLSSEDIKRFASALESFINNKLPMYERNMIQRIKVLDDLSLSIIERTGEEIPFSSTNAGRRWFYTYFFVKECLQPGDILLMDEPANNLHPEAQIHIRKDIEELSISNKIIMTTHSPYLISPSSYVYYVEMSDAGTMLRSLDNIGIQQMAKNLGVFESETIIGDLLIKNELLSIESIGRRINEILKNRHIKQKDAAAQLCKDEREFRKKLTGKHLTYSDITTLCNVYKINPMEILMKNQMK